MRVMPSDHRGSVGHRQEPWPCLKGSSVGLTCTEAEDGRHCDFHRRHGSPVTQPVL